MREWAERSCHGRKVSGGALALFVPSVLVTVTMVAWCNGRQRAAASGRDGNVTWRAERSLVRGTAGSLKILILCYFEARWTNCIKAVKKFGGLDGREPLRVLRQEIDTTSRGPFRRY